MSEKMADDNIEDDDGAVMLRLDVVVDRALVPQTRFGEDGSVGVEWAGRCWVWLSEGQAPSLVDVVVNDSEAAKLLEPGKVQRVRAIQRVVETPGGPVDGLELWPEFEGEPEPERRATARGLWEGGKVRIADRALQDGMKGAIGTLLRFTIGTVEVDGRGYSMGLKDLEPVDAPSDVQTGEEEAK